jgi:oxygen-dependent protoporphyrinogen oxidase
MIAIIGGGITGLAAAHELTRRGLPFTLFEASPRTGGLIRTEHIDGFTIEAGPDSILVQKPAALTLCEEVGLGDRLIATTPPRTAFVLKRGRLHALPSPSILGIPTTLSGVLRYDLLSWPARARLALEPLVPVRRDPSDESVASFFARRFGPATVPLVAEPLLGGIHAGDITALSMTSLFPRFIEAEARNGSVLQAFKNTRRDTEGLFRSLAGGMGELVAAIDARIPPGSVRCSSPVEGIESHGGAWRLLVSGQSASARAVIVATPAHVAARLLGSIDWEAGALCAEVPYVSTASVALAWPRRAIPHPLSGSGFVVARTLARERITACTWVSSKWTGRAPADTALLRAFIGGAHDPGAVDLSDAELVAIAAADIGRVLRISGPPLLSRVYRWRDAGAQHNVGQLARVARIEARLATHPGLFVAGSGFRSVGIPDCVADGRAAAGVAASFVGRTS